jgi:hypothetical protein
MTSKLSTLPGGAVRASGSRGSRLLGSLKDALAAASRDDIGHLAMIRFAQSPLPVPPAAVSPVAASAMPVLLDTPPVVDNAKPISAAEAAREARLSIERQLDTDPPTRVIRGRAPEAPAARTQLVRGKSSIKRGTFDQDPVVGWLVVVGGPGMGQYRPIFEGNNTVGRADTNRVALDFGDDAISAEEQAYIRYDSAERTFLFVPNLTKTNVVSVNDKRPAQAMSLTAMDVITVGRTQLVFVPFCGADFDWSAIAPQKD